MRRRHEKPQGSRSGRGPGPLRLLRPLGPVTLLALLALLALPVLPAGPAAASPPQRSPALPGPPLELALAESEPDPADAAWRGRFCTAARCRRGDHDAVLASAGFGGSVLLAGWLARRRGTPPH